jgi:methionyl-tRNA formyltransferase
VLRAQDGARGQQAHLLLAQKKIPTPKDLSVDNLRSHLFTIGAQLLPLTIDAIAQQKTVPVSQDQTKATYAGRLVREDGFVPWKTLMLASEGTISEAHYNQLAIIQKLTKYLGHGNKSPIDDTRNTPRDIQVIPRMIRALSPWPGVWSTVEIPSQPPIMHRRIKILQAHVADEKLVVDLVQLEGKKPVTYKQFADAYLR